MKAGMMDGNSKVRTDSGVLLWLASGCLLIFLMVIVGGITRLTGSGLSITEWKVVTGSIPPMNEVQWQQEFEKYQQIPQYKLINAHFTLVDFKSIYWWEYIHRLLGRLIGLVFIIPFIYFLVKKRLRKSLMPHLFFMFFLGALQGFIGWYMVSSGLTENTRVSHLRLALHLGTAFITFGYIYYVFLRELYLPHEKMRTGVMPVLLVLLIFTQIIYGAFVAGMLAGHTYNTWPTMEGEWIPESLTFAWGKDGWSSLLNNPASVQFIHRNLAYLISILVFVLWMKYRGEENKRSKSVNLLMMVVLIQAGLGIYTLLAHVPLWLGIAHQAAAFLLFAVAIRHFFIEKYITVFYRN